MPRVVVTRGRVIASVVFVVAIVAFLYFGLPKLVGFSASVKRLREGNGWWLAGAAVLECLSFCGYIVLFRAVFVQRTSRIGWKASYQITMAGLAATRLFAAAGAGGIALTAWALRRSGMEPRLVASRMITFIVLLYVVYMSALVIDGVGLYLRLWPGPAPFAITIVPAIFGASVIGFFICMSLLPRDFDRIVSCASAAAVWPAGSRGSSRPCRPRPRPGSARRWRWSAAAILGCWARSPGGRSTSRRCGRASTRSDTRPIRA